MKQIKFCTFIDITTGKQYTIINTHKFIIKIWLWKLIPMIPIVLNDNYVITLFVINTIDFQKKK